MSARQHDFVVLPAIDLKAGRCVRLRQGRADDETVYSDDPADVAQNWENQGATWLHVVDLDGAFQGHPAHLEQIAKIVRAVSIPVEVGGGIRTRRDADILLGLGVKRVIIGTKAVESPNELGKWTEEMGSALAVGIDARAGLVQVKGWTQTGDCNAKELAIKLAGLGVRTLIYTDTATDGMMQGPNLAAVDAFCRAVPADVIASGGIRSADDVLALRRLGSKNLIGAIVGKALYERKAALSDLIAAAGPYAI